MSLGDVAELFLLVLDGEFLQMFVGTEVTLKSLVPCFATPACCCFGLLFVEGEYEFLARG